MHNTIYRKLVIGGDISLEESEILDVYKKFIDISGRFLASNDAFMGLEARGLISFYLIQASYCFFRGIFNLWIDRGYHSAYLLGRGLVEYYINYCFVLAEGNDFRAQEFLTAYDKNCDPFGNSKKYKYIVQRAEEVGLKKLYDLSYKSLCSFSHPNLKGSLIARRTKKFVEDRPQFLLHMLFTFIDLFEIGAMRLGLVYPKELKDLIEDTQTRLKSKIKGENITPVFKTIHQKS